MTADPLVEMVSSLCRWPVRSTTAQAFINARLSELHDVLTAHQVTEAIRGLLFLSVSPKSEVLLRLTARASRIASALNEYNVLTLFDSPNSFRLLSDPSVTTPLLLAAAHKVRDPAQRQRIGTKVARSDLPPDFLTPHLQRLRCLTPGESRPLQLSH
ncbi:hypothetical protein ADEAN_000514500 [Angomonas deanei]|uniref:Uncharacterized protein n=1 Tax=Angomonas deanei TaxID=59799 RepID=A0A7G2CCW3_9TRYP|nr:hypothetical protein ADEAN_000514500 [Angomonas deanei]